MKNIFYIYAVTLVATLGGLLFGYDTAVVSGTTSALDNYFVKPLLSDPSLAGKVLFEYNTIILLSLILISSLFVNFLIKLFKLRKGAIYSSIFIIAVLFLWYTKLNFETHTLTSTLASSLKGFIISCALIGCIIGGALGGTLSQLIGRRNGLLLAAALFLISAIGSALPDSLNIFRVQVVSSLIFYRIVGGIGVGIASMLSPVYIAEIAAPEMRGKLVSLNQFAIILGMLIVYFVNYFIAKGAPDIWINTIGWRWMFASEIIPCLLFFFLLFLVPKSPRYLVYRGADDQALRVLSKFYKAADVRNEYNLIKSSLIEKNAPWLSFGPAVLIIGILLSFFQQAIGINVVLYYAPEIFRTMGLKNDVALLQTIIVGVINLSFTVLAIFTVDRLGRRPLMMIGAVGMGLSMLFLGLTFYFNSLGIVSLLCMLLYTASFAMSWGPVCWVLLSEIFPNSIKGALSISVAIQWLSNFLVSWSFPYLNENQFLTGLFNHAFPYWIYCLMCLFAFLFIWKFVPETKGRSLENIEKLWGNKKV